MTTISVLHSHIDTTHIHSQRHRDFPMARQSDNGPFLSHGNYDGFLPHGHPLRNAVSEYPESKNVDTALVNMKLNIARIANAAPVTLNCRDTMNVMIVVLNVVVIEPIVIIVLIVPIVHIVPIVLIVILVIIVIIVVVFVFLLVMSSLLNASL